MCLDDVKYRQIAFRTQENLKKPLYVDPVHYTVEISPGFALVIDVILRGDKDHFAYALDNGDPSAKFVRVLILTHHDIEG